MYETAFTWEGGGGGVVSLRHSVPVDCAVHFGLPWQERLMG